MDMELNLHLPVRSIPSECDRNIRPSREAVDYPEIIEKRIRQYLYLVPPSPL
jgi:hypothetical protein